MICSKGVGIVQTGGFYKGVELPRGGSVTDGPPLLVSFTPRVSSWYRILQCVLQATSRVPPWTEYTSLSSSSTTGWKVRGSFCWHQNAQQSVGFVLGIGRHTSLFRYSWLARTFHWRRPVSSSKMLSPKELVKTGAAGPT